MTSSQSRLHNQIVAKTAEFERVQGELLALKKRCVPHCFVQDGESAVCEICAQPGGWWCPKSDDHRCDYDRNGCCIHCGDTEERK